MYFQHIATDTVLPVKQGSMQYSDHEDLKKGKTAVHIGFVKWKNEW